jgi:hypothetical protein
MSAVSTYPRYGNPQRRPSFAVGAGGGGEARQTVAALAAVAFGDVQGDGAERAPDLLAQVAVVAANGEHGWT